MVKDERFPRRAGLIVAMKDSNDARKRIEAEIPLGFLADYPGFLQSLAGDSIRVAVTFVRYSEPPQGWGPQGPGPTEPQSEQLHA